MDVMAMLASWHAWRGTIGQILDVWLVVYIGICIYTDFRYGKLYDKVTLPTMVVFVGLSVLKAGLPGGLTSLAGLALVFTIFIVIGLMGGMGGGDVKFMGAVGAFFGWRLGLWAVFYAILGAGLTAIVVMLGRGSLWRTLKRIGHSLRTIVTPGLKVESPSKDDSETIPFGVGGGMGVLATWVLSALGELPPLI